MTEGRIQGAAGMTWMSVKYDTRYGRTGGRWLTRDTTVDGATYPLARDRESRVACHSVDWAFLLVKFLGC